MLKQQTLNIIQSGTDEEVYSTVTYTALYLATGGYLDEANRVLTALWNYKLPHTRSTWLPDIGFMMLWNSNWKEC